MKYVMGDVHGDYLHLKQMLERIRFNPEKDHIFSWRCGRQRPGISKNP